MIHMRFMYVDFCISYFKTIATVFTVPYIRSLSLTLLNEALLSKATYIFPQKKCKICVHVSLLFIKGAFN